MFNSAYRFIAHGARLLLAATCLAATAHAQHAPATDFELRLPANMADRVLACTACHGAEGRAGADGYYPRIAGKPVEYLYHQLLYFRDGRRQYMPMAWLLQTLPDSYLHDIAEHFSNQHPPYQPPPRSNTPAAVLKRGEQLVLHGQPGTPACVACHGAGLTGVNPAIPGLLGLPRDYILAQLGAWQTGTRSTPAPDCMADIMQGMAPADVAAVAAWLSVQPVPGNYRPRTAPEVTLPLACHGVPQPVSKTAREVQ